MWPTVTWPSPSTLVIGISQQYGSFSIDNSFDSFATLTCWWSEIFPSCISVHMVTSTSNFCWERIHLSLWDASKYQNFEMCNTTRPPKCCVANSVVISTLHRWSCLQKDWMFAEFHWIVSTNTIKSLLLSFNCLAFITGIVFVSGFYNWYCFLVWLFVLFSYSNCILVTEYKVSALYT